MTTKAKKTLARAVANRYLIENGYSIQPTICEGVEFVAKKDEVLVFVLAGYSKNRQQGNITKARTIKINKAIQEDFINEEYNGMWRVDLCQVSDCGKNLYVDYFEAIL